MKTLHKII